MEARNEEDNMKIEELKHEVKKAIDNRPPYIRKGQCVFNYIDSTYGVARAVQFEDGVDCFHNDDMINRFLELCLLRINGKRS